MGEKTIVTTLFGRDKAATEFCTDLFRSRDAALNYVNRINHLKKRDDGSWIYALISEDGKPYTLRKPFGFVFEDMLMFDDRSLQRVIREANDQDLARALKNAAPELVEKILHNMSPRAAGMLKEDMECLGDIKLRHVEEAQGKIGLLIAALEDRGEILINLEIDETLV
jgi:flagellar motor switch protein FliG